MLFDVDLDPDTEVVTTIGAKEGFTHLMWVLLGPGDSAIVPSPSYPIHLAGPGLRRGPGDHGADARSRREHATTPARTSSRDCSRPGSGPSPKPRVIVVSFPHNPDQRLRGPRLHGAPGRLRPRTRGRGLSRLRLRRPRLRRVPAALDPRRCPGAKECCVELYTLTKSFSMAGWRVGFVVGNPEIVAALTKLKSYLDYGTFQPVQIAAIVAMNEAQDYPEAAARHLPVAS